MFFLKKLLLCDVSYIELFIRKILNVHNGINLFWQNYSQLLHHVSNLVYEVAPSPTLRCSSHWKGIFRVTLDYGRQLYLRKIKHQKVCKIFHFIWVCFFCNKTLGYQILNWMCGILIGLLTKMKLLYYCRK